MPPPFQPNGAFSPFRDKALQIYSLLLLSRTATKSICVLTFAAMDCLERSDADEPTKHTVTAVVHLKHSLQVATTFNFSTLTWLLAMAVPTASVC